MRTILAALWLTLWIGSLMLPVAITGTHPSGDPGAWSGLMILAMGWLGVFGLQFGWIANLAFFVSVLLLVFSRRRTMLTYMSSACLAVLAADALLWHDLPADDAADNIQAFGAGYYVWFVAMFGAAASLAFCWFGRSEVETIAQKRN